jgi:hypothetical protein
MDKGQIQKKGQDLNGLGRMSHMSKSQRILMGSRQGKSSSTMETGDRKSPGGAMIVRMPSKLDPSGGLKVVKKREKRVLEG